MTSNLGGAVYQDPSITPEERREVILQDVRGAFRPEFVNRIDEIVVFDPLGPDQIREIVDIQIALLTERIAERDLSVTLTDEARDTIARRGYDAAFGARPLRRLIQREIGDRLAMMLLSGEVAAGDRIVIDAAGQELAYRVQHHGSDAGSLPILAT
jgi:ATP-dependent Clp protease ATP-binding subunit ClpB